MIFEPILAFMVGVLIGSHSPWWVEAIIIIASVLYMSSWHFRQHELGCIPILFLILLLWAGMITADAIVYFAYEHGSLDNLTTKIWQFIIPHN